ncbi:vacuolar protein sorting-associated protein 45 [Phlyctochytrium planicorne]|nr:vacuolar protein sorting-associated protein 45 [Phlyctochytrium planicorne]
MAIAAITVLICALLLEVFSLLGYKLIGEKVNIILYLAIIKCSDLDAKVSVLKTYRLFRTILPSQFTKKITALRTECITVKKEMDSTSAMDEFAKWAKLRRRFDKLFAEMESSGKIEAADRASFERSVSWGLWAVMWIFQTYLIISYSAEAMFFVPYSWTGPFGFILSLPWAPRGKMDGIKSVQNYLNKMIQEVSGMKVLLLDAQTVSLLSLNHRLITSIDHKTPIISVVVTQSQLLSREIYLVDRLDNRQRDKMRHLKCIVFARPTPESIQALVEELREPSYGDYYLYFSNTLKKSSIERLAEADECEVVREVQEYFADFLAINSDLYSLGVSAPEYPLFTESSAIWDNKTFTRVTEGILAVLLALKKKPLIRYERTSTLGKKLAAEITYQIQQEGPLFDFRKTDTPPILLILDRRNDPVTPLLNQWTYQAMIHETHGIDNNRVDLSSLPEIRPELKEIVLSPDTDPFYRKNMFLNLGDLGANIKTYVDEYQVKHKSSMKIDSITDMKKFMEDYPEFRKLSGNVTKHVTLVGELSRRVDREGLLEVGELEQSLAVLENHNNDFKSLQKVLQQTQIPEDQKIRLAILYALRYEKSTSNQLSQILELLRRSGVSEKKISLIESVVLYAGADQRMEDLFANQDILARTKQAFKGLKGVENVYTQHVPHLVNTLQEMIKGRLKTDNYPFIDGSTRDKPQDIIVFMIGGTTYAEAREINKLNASTPGVRIILGGTTIHNSKSFLREVSDSVSRWVSKPGADSPNLQKLKTSRLE